MRSDKAQGKPSLTTRQKVTAGIFVVILIVIIWQIKGLFGGGGSSSSVPAVATGKAAMNGNMPGGVPQQPTPRPAPIPKQPAPMTQREAELMQLQQETEAKYIAAVNELQMLKIQRDIAETNKAIMSAKLDTVNAEKNIVQALTKPVVQESPAAYAQGLVNPGSGAAPAAGPGKPPATPPSTIQQQVNYTVVSVSELHYKWAAVIGSGGSLYNVSVGDVLPADGSTVVSIDRAGVVLDKNGTKRKISLVPII